MNHYLIVGIIAVGLISIPITLISSQSEIEDYTEEEKTVKFQRIQFEFYVLVSDIGDGDKFLSDIELERAKYVLKSIPIPISSQLWCPHPQVGDIWMFWGSYVFKNGVDADKVKQWIKNNIPLEKIRYGYYYLLDNNHHWDNPQPDKIIEFQEWGDKAQYDQANITCNS